jgi:hypothetical protein
MTDDERLGALFHAAASDSAAPEPAFDHEAVVRRSRQITTRRRTAVVVGGLALFAVVGVGGAIVLPGGGAGGGDATSAAAPMLAPEGPAADAQAQRRARPPAAAEDAPGAAPEVFAAPGTAEGGRSPLGPGTAGCADRQDPALRAVVEEFLPEAVGAPEAAVTEECRPGGERGVSLQIADGATAGLLTVQYLPPGTAPRPREGAVSAVTASGGTVVVSSRGDGPGAAAPFADRIDTLAAQLAPRL